MFESSPYATELDENHLERNMILTYIYKSKICLIISTSLLDYLAKCKSRFLQFIFCFRGLRCRPFRTRHVLKVLKFNILMTLFAQAAAIFSSSLQPDMRPSSSLDDDFSNDFFVVHFQPNLCQSKGYASKLLSSERKEKNSRKISFL